MEEINENNTKPIKRRLTEKKWLECIAYYKSGYGVKETCEKYNVSPNALFTQLRNRGTSRKGKLSARDRKKLEKGSFLNKKGDKAQAVVEKVLKDSEVQEKIKEVKEQIEVLPKEQRVLMAEEIVKERKAEIKQAIMEKAEEFDLYAKINKLDKFDGKSAELHLKIYDEVLNILQDKNPILAKNLSALVGKIMLRANDMLDNPDLKSFDLNNVANALSKVNDIMQIVPKTQPLIAQQFNIGNMNKKESEYKKDYNINIEFIE